MKINISDKSTFINKFLSPLNKINENAVLRINRDKISSLTSTNDGTLILHTVYKCNNECEAAILNVPDVNKFINSGEHSYSDIEAVNKSVASSMIRVLNQYQNGSQEIPEEVM